MPVDFVMQRHVHSWPSSWLLPEWYGHLPLLSLTRIPAEIHSQIPTMFNVALQKHVLLLVKQEYARTPTNLAPVDHTIRESHLPSYIFVHSGS